MFYLYCIGASFEKKFIITSGLPQANKYQVTMPKVVAVRKSHAKREFQCELKKRLHERVGLMSPCSGGNFGTQKEQEGKKRKEQVADSFGNCHR